MKEKNNNEFRINTYVSGRINGFRVVMLLLVVAVGAGPAVKGSFIWDDHHVIERGVLIKDLSNIPELFSHDTMYNSDNGQYEARQGMDTYRPLTMTTFALDYRLFGPGPEGFHITNLALHAICTILVYFLCLALLGENKQTPALLAATWFGLQPWSAEAYAWINGRSDPLATAFSLAAVLLFIKHIDGRKQWYKSASLCLSIVFFIMACLSKEIAILLPIILTLFAFIRNESGNRNTLSGFRLSMTRLRPLAPLFILYSGAAAFYLSMRTMALSGSLKVVEDYSRLVEAITNLGLLTFDGMRQAVMPSNVHLRFLYEDYYHVDLWWKILALVLLFSLSLFLLALLFPVGGRPGSTGQPIGTVSGTVRENRVSHRALSGLSGLWFILFLAPACLITPAPNYYGFGRYLYMPLAGIAPLIGLASELVLAKLAGRRGLSIAAGIGATIYLVAMGSQLEFFISDLKDDKSLALSTIEQDPKTSHGYAALARLLALKGKMKKARAVVIDAMGKLDKRPLSMYMLGRSLLQAGLTSEVSMVTEKGLKDYPDFSGFYCLKAALTGLTKPKVTLELLERGLALDPENRDCKNLLYNMPR
ncbi:MAG: hypothetical protein GXP49_07405 [Deltaproteobacteria bacterium]|nr:hypothetical protein [Deltaproteobacteria bacterium]